jgi:DNA-binding NarL/FixJ family response regulator
MGLLQADGDVEVVGDAGRGEEAVALAEELKPEMVIMQVDEDLEMAREELEGMLAVDPRPRVVILSMHYEPRFIRRMLELGPSAYVHKSLQADELLAVVRSTALDSESQDTILSMPEEMIEQIQNASEPGLSARELETLLWVARGFSNRQIASRVSVSEATVKRHLANSYQKLGVASRTEAVNKGLSEGWLRESDFTSGRHLNRRAP